MESARVFPSAAIDEHAVKLAVCDVYFPKIWVMFTNFWPVADSTDIQHCYDVLKQGLSRTLTECPALAGKVVASSEDPRDLHIQVDAGAWVDFELGKLSQVAGLPDYCALKSNAFPLTDLREKLMPKAMTLPVTEGSGVIVAKLQEFKGGMALTYGVNHAFADASTVAEIEKMWSLHTADVTRGIAQQFYRKQLPDEEIRKRLSTPKEGAGEFRRRHWKLLPSHSSQVHLPRLQPTGIVTQVSGFQVPSKESDRVNLEPQQRLPRDPKVPKWNIWNFSRESLARLKKDAASSDTSQWISTKGALLGLFWSRVASIKQKSKEGFETSSTILPISLRQRLTPPIDSQYLGNAVDIISVNCSLKDLEDDDEGLITASQSLRRAVEEWSEAEWDAWLALACTLPPTQVMCFDLMVALDANNVFFNDRSQSKSYGLHWGEHIGSIDRVRCTEPIPPIPHAVTALVLHPKLPDGSTEVGAIIDDELLHALKTDPVMARYAKLSCTFE